MNSAKPTAAPITTDELRAILADAQQRGDIYTVREAKRALAGSYASALACAAILSR